MLKRSRPGDTDIAATAGVRVLKPSTTDIVALLDELKISHAKLPDELDSETQTGHAGPDDKDFSIKGHIDDNERQPTRRNTWSAGDTKDRDLYTCLLA